MLLPPLRAERYEDIGQYLYHCRTMQNLPIEEASSQLNIRARYLIALENGSLDELPGQAYIKGYLQNYADYLGLDRAHIVKQYDLVQQYEKQPKFFVPEPNRRENIPTRHVLIASMAIITFFALLWVSLVRETPPTIEQMYAVPDHFSYLVSARFYYTNTVYGCYAAKEPDLYPFCATGAALKPPQFMPWRYSILQQVP